MEVASLCLTMQNMNRHGTPSKHISNASRHALSMMESASHVVSNSYVNLTITNA